MLPSLFFGGHYFFRKTNQQFFLKALKIYTSSLTWSTLDLRFVQCGNTKATGFNKLWIKSFSVNVNEDMFRKFAITKE